MKLSQDFERYKEITDNKIVRINRKLEATLALKEKM